MQPQGRRRARRLHALPPRHANPLQHDLRSTPLKGAAMRFDIHTLSAIATVTCFAMPLAQAQGTTLDGRAFVADAGEKGKAADEKSDVITFAGGKFHSSACDQYG